MAAPPELSQLLAQSRDRVAYQNPLFQAVTQMAYAGLPTYARQGTQLSGSLSNVAPLAPTPTPGGIGPGTAGILGGLGGAALNALGSGGSGGGGALGALISGIKKLLASKPTTVQGNKPYPGGALTGGGQPALYLFPGMAGNEGIDPNRWPGGGPSVTTNESYGFPNDILNDPYFLNSLSNGMPNDPSGGSGIGPGMQDFYDWLKQQGGGGGMGDQGPLDDWWHP